MLQPKLENIIKLKTSLQVNIVMNGAYGVRTNNAEFKK